MENDVLSNESAAQLAGISNLLIGYENELVRVMQHPIAAHLQSAREHIFIAMQMMRTHRERWEQPL